MRMKMLTMQIKTVNIKVREKTFSEKDNIKF